MTEDEAKKIIDWLCMRWEKKVIGFYKNQNDRFKLAVKFLNRKWRMNDEDNTLSLNFEYAWLTPDESQWFNTRSRIYAIPELKGFDYNDMLKSDVELKTDSEFLDFVFKFGKEGVYVKDWQEDGACFIYPGESIEEIKVKMDLEEIS